MTFENLPVLVLPFFLLLSWEVLLRRHICRALHRHLQATGVALQVSFDGFLPSRPTFHAAVPSDASAHARLQTEEFQARLTRLVAAYRWTVGPLRETLYPFR